MSEGGLRGGQKICSRLIIRLTSFKKNRFNIFPYCNLMITILMVAVDYIVNIINNIHSCSKNIQI